jgi:hypothetical protein
MYRLKVREASGKPKVLKIDADEIGIIEGGYGEGGLDWMCFYKVMKKNPEAKKATLIQVFMIPSINVLEVSFTNKRSSHDIRPLSRDTQGSSGAGTEAAGSGLEKC